MEDLFNEPAVQSPLSKCFSVQSLQRARDSLHQGLVALSGHTNTSEQGFLTSVGAKNNKLHLTSYNFIITDQEVTHTEHLHTFHDVLLKQVLLKHTQSTNDV